MVFVRLHSRAHGGRVRAPRRGLLTAGRAGAQKPGPVSEEQRIARAAALALIVAASAMGIVRIAALESQIRHSIESKLRHLLDAQLAEPTTYLELRTTRAEIITTRPNMLRYLRIIATGRIAVWRPAG